MSATPPDGCTAGRTFAAVLLAAALAPTPDLAQTAVTTAQPSFGTNINLGVPLYGGYGAGYGLNPYGGYPPSPYGNNNQSLQTTASPPPGSQQTSPGQSQLPSMTEGGSQGGGGGGGGGSSGVGGAAATAAACPRPGAAPRPTPATS